VINDLWTFGDVSRAQRGASARFRRFLGFNVICSFGLALNVVLLNLFFNFAHMNRYAANALAIGAVTGWNYWLNRKLNWSNAKTAALP